MNKKIGIFGGSFNPVHLGHMLVAQAAREELDLARLYFVPASQSPFKPEQCPVAGEKRLRMLRLATAGLTWCVVDEREIRRGGVSFTVDTLEEYRRENPDATLYWLIGADNVSQLPKWRDARRLAALADFVAIPRPGDAQAPFPAPFRGLYLKGFPVAISSSEIRGRVAAGEPIELLVPPPVAEVIRNNRLYL